MLTSNRDELDFRPTLPPDIYSYGDGKLVFPKDELAGGSWIAMNDKGNVNCLLNGAFVAHQKQAHHTKSRGTVLLEFTRSALTAQAFFSQEDLHHVEPFTIVALKQSKGKILDFDEFIWDGNEKHFKVLDSSNPQIWSSVTLYDKEQRQLKSAWFNQFCQKHRNAITKEKVVDFHCGNHTDGKSKNMLIQEDGDLKTVSISQVSLSNQKLQMGYYDLLNDSVTKVEL
jgi:uncharacterized protein with NRDE domain